MIITHRTVAAVGVESPIWPRLLGNQPADWQSVGSRRGSHKRSSIEWNGKSEQRCRCAVCWKIKYVAKYLKCVW